MCQLPDVGPKASYVGGQNLEAAGVRIALSDQRKGSVRGMRPGWVGRGVHRLLVGSRLGDGWLVFRQDCSKQSFLSDVGGSSVTLVIGVSSPLAIRTL